MPNPTIKKVSNTCNIELDKVEELFVQAEKLAEEQGKSRNYAYIMGIFKKSLGQDCLEKLNWNSSEVKESGILFNIQQLILEAISIVVPEEIKLKICKELIKNEIVQDNIKKFGLKNDAKVMCKTLKIQNVKEAGGTLEIVIFPINEKSNNGYLGEHTCYVECEPDFSKIYNVSLNG
jgi:hypothetical protein